MSSKNRTGAFTNLTGVDHSRPRSSWSRLLGLFPSTLLRCQPVSRIPQVGLPYSGVRRLFQFIDDGAMQEDIERALLEAIGIGAMRGWLPSPLPRKGARALQHSFAAQTERATLRQQFQELVRVLSQRTAFPESADIAMSF